MIIVSNTGPLIGLAKIQQLDLLGRLGTEVYIPPQVQLELLAKTGTETALIAAALKATIHVKAPAILDAAAETILRRTRAKSRPLRWRGASLRLSCCCWMIVPAELPHRNWDSLLRG